MVCHHNDISTPLLLKSEQCTHAYGVNSCLSHTVKAIDTPLKVALHAGRMVNLIVLTVVSLLEADNAVKSVLRKLIVIFGLQRHHLYLDIREILLGYIYCLGKIWYTGLGRVLSRYKENILKRGEFLYCLILILYLLWCKDGARHGVAAVETTIHA